MSAPAISHTDEELDGMLADAGQARGLWQRWFYGYAGASTARDNAADMAPRLAANIESLVAELRHARAASSSSTPLSETPSEPIRACDYADKSPAHRDKPATRNVRGYRICEDCYVAMREAERQWDEAQVRASLAPLSEPTSEGT